MNSPLIRGEIFPSSVMPKGVRVALTVSLSGVTDEWRASLFNTSEDLAGLELSMVRSVLV